MDTVQTALAFVVILVPMLRLLVIRED